MSLKDEKATIHEFLDTLERITNELRTDPRAAAFLSRVKKADAPDYYDIIKRPMDLGTVLKKVKAGSYKTKSQFIDDLELIWSNCLLYNSIPDHHLRPFAESLRIKANNLLKFVSEPCPTPHVIPRTARPSPRPPSLNCFSRQSQTVSSGLSLAERRWAASERGGAFQPTTDEDEVGLAEPSSSTHSSFMENKQQNTAFRLEDHPTLFRRDEKMYRFADWEEPGPWQNHIDTSAAHRPLQAALSESDLCILGDWIDAMEWSLTMCQLPELPFATPVSIGTKKKGKDRETGLVKALGLITPIAANIKTLWEIKRVHKKITDLMAGQQPQLEQPVISPEPMDETEAGTMEEVAEEEPDEEEPNLDRFQSAIQHLPSEVYTTSLASEATYQVMRQVVTMLVTHAGFDSTYAGALNFLTEIAIQFLSNIGRTLHFFSDRFSATLSSSEIVQQTLGANGISGFEPLEAHVRDDVRKYGTKLKELLRKVEAGYGPAGFTAARAFGDQDLFARDGEALVTGEFTNELGEDFFGLKELGLDAELGTSALRIPSRLFHGRPVDSAEADPLLPELESKPEPRFVKPMTFVELEPEAIDLQIGLLRAIYRARLNSKEFELRDDDQVTGRVPKVIRPKVPPSGKIPIKRRMPAPAAAPAVPPSKKKKVSEEEDNGRGTIEAPSSVMEPDPSVLEGHVSGVNEFESNGAVATDEQPIRVVSIDSSSGPSEMVPEVKVDEVG